MQVTPLLSRAAANHDIARSGANVRLIDSPGFFTFYGWGNPVDVPRPFLVKRCAPMDALDAWIQNDVMMRGALDHLSFGSSPDLLDCDDPETLAEVIREHHDYPDADMLGHYTTEA